MRDLCIGRHLGHDGVCHPLAKIRDEIVVQCVQFARGPGGISNRA